MHKFRVELELNYDGITSDENPNRPKSKSYINAVMREDVHAQVQDALEQYGFKADVYLVRKVNS
jgi:hypothetical protein